MNPIEIWVNGKKQAVAEGWTVSDLVADLPAVRGPVAVELNEAIIRRQEWDQVTLKSGDRLEVVHFVGGGDKSNG